MIELSRDTTIAALEFPLIHLLVQNFVKLFHRFELQIQVFLLNTNYRENLLANPHQNATTPSE